MIKDDQEKIKAERIKQQEKESITKPARQLLKARRRLQCQYQGCNEMVVEGGTSCKLCGSECATCMKPVFGTRTFCCACNENLHPTDQ